MPRGRPKSNRRQHRDRGVRQETQPSAIGIPKNAHPCPDSWFWILGCSAIRRGRKMKINSAIQNDDTVTRIASLRLAVGLLGERDGANWWTSGFLSPASTAFLAPVFGSSVLPARYQGVLDAARRVHDERIGVGHVLHLFRLPESIEQRLFEVVQLCSLHFAMTVSSSDSAKVTLENFVNKAMVARSGPALMTSSETLDPAEWIGEAASLYSAAFSAGVQCFPYIAGSR
jgi:hypothetical protein